MSWVIENCKAIDLQPGDTVLINSIVTVRKVMKCGSSGMTIYWQEGQGSLGCTEDYVLQVLRRKYSTT